MAPARRAEAGGLSPARCVYAVALDVINRVVPESDPLRAGILIDIGVLRISEERYSEAEEHYRKAPVLDDKYGNGDTSSRSSALGGLGVVYRDTARYREARQAIGEAIK